MSSTSQFRSFDLPGLLPAVHVLVVNQRDYIVTELSQPDCCLVAQSLFSDLELYALVTLLEVWPHYCPYETLLSALSDLPIDQARAIIHNAMEARTMDATLNGLRNLLARTRPRLHDFQLDIVARRGLGYGLARIAD